MRYFFITIFVFCLFVFYQGLKKNPRDIPSNLISQEIPEFYISSFNGPNLSHIDLKKDEIKIVNFFASWCPPCTVEHKQLQSLSKKVTTYGIAKKNKNKDLSKWLGKLGNPYKNIGMDYEGLVSIEWGVYALPETFLIDKNGIIKYKHVGPIMQRDLEKLENLIRKLR